MLCLVLCCLLLASSQASAIDVVLHNGKVWTGDPGHASANAIAIDKGRIVAVGSDADILKLATGDSQRIDLKGRRVVPGINDAHTHLSIGLPSFDIELPRDAGSARVQEAIAAQPSTGDLWITADIGIDVLQDPAMRRATLDALQPQRPVLLTAWTGHGMLINSAAQRALGLSLDDIAAGWGATHATRSTAASTNTPSGNRGCACRSATNPCAA